MTVQGALRLEWLPRAQRALGRPVNSADGTRWLFAVLALASLALVLPSALYATSGNAMLLGAVGSAALCASWARGYLSGRASFLQDAVDLAAIAALSMACANPLKLLPFVFSALWFRSLYGSAARALVRGLLCIVAMLSSGVLWRTIPHLTPPSSLGVVVATAPAVVLTVIGARRLGSTLRAREQSLVRGAALAKVGAQLLGARDAATIRTLAWAAGGAVCDATPGLRLLTAIDAGEQLQVVRAWGEFRTVPVVLPIPGSRDGLDAPDDDGAVSEALASAAGPAMTWTWVPVKRRGDDPWMFFGAPDTVPADASLAVQSLLTMVSLALGNSEVRAELTVQARIDSLTGLPNRAAFSMALASALAVDADPPASHILFIDLDGFKAVNDGVGHNAGDAVLRSAALRIRSCVRAGDVCARIGGDEFGVVLVGRSRISAVEVAQRMVDALKAPVSVGSRSARVGASIGIAPAEPGMSPLVLRHHADLAMYAAKSLGKGQIRMFSPDLLPSPDEAPHSTD